MGTEVASRLSWEEAHRLELTLRARALRLTGGRPVCPGCGKPATMDDVRLAGHLVHQDCLCLCRSDAA